ncbi:hypothetical protein [Candidatus Blastococcus massiliensis]|uniref:hypothetical protein n=1 Tax=Candidatus Blastococcus massiliensis TaxID=1470358 RepID=UPI0006854DDF|nr:hypothetical protein [Candidatus Blastococcus massiliensis]
MSQPPYPPPGGSDAGGDQPQVAYPGQGYPGQGFPGQGFPGQAYEGPPPSGYVPYQGGPQYGQYGQYGQQVYGQQAYPGQYGVPVPPWGQGGGGPSPGSGRGTVVALAVGAAVVIAALAVALVIGLRSDDGGTGSGSSLPEATSEPDGLGNDPELDSFAWDCHDGDMQACDDLFQFSPEGAAYELYGGTCAGRQSNSLAHEEYCVDAFPPSS